MDIIYNNLVKNYLRIRIWGDSIKYGIVDANNGKEYVQPIFDDIQYHKDVNMIELDFTDTRHYGDLKILRSKLIPYNDVINIILIYYMF